MEYGFLSILPPLLAVILAIITKETLISLLSGVILGNFILKHGSFIPSLKKTLDDLLVQINGNTSVVVFSFLVGAIIILIQVSGGVRGFVIFLTEKSKLVKNRKHALFLTVFLGIAMFFESSINILVSGTVTRPLTDKYKVSREELAYVCDSVAAPVCGIVPFNGWGATLMALIGVQVTAGVISGNPASLLIKSIPFNFYSILSFISICFYIITNKHWGPMKKAVIRAKTTGKLLADGAVPLIDEEGHHSAILHGVKPCLWNMLIPLLVVVGMIPVGLYITGHGDMLAGSGSTSVYWAVVASLVVTAIYYILIKRIISGKIYIQYLYKGIGSMVPMIVLLLLGFMIGSIGSELGTGKYLASLIEGSLHGAYGPAIIFILSAFIAFSTGTSWGTFALMLPIGLQMAVAIDANISVTIGAVISGALMGDHCSPISDTTILASMATASDHIDHVKTQLPYALLNGFFATILYLIAGYFL